MGKKKSRDVWVFAEQRNGELHDVSLELLGKARELSDKTGSKVVAILIGYHVHKLAQTLVNHGADVVFVADEPTLENYRLLPYTYVFESVIKEHEPDIVLMGATAMGVEFAPRLAARVRTGLSAHCIDLKLDENGNLLQVVPGWGGGVVATIACPDHRPQMSTVMPGAMRALPEKEREGQIEKIYVDLPDSNMGPEVLGVERVVAGEQPLEKADIVVAGGWGVGNKENWALLEELAGLLGGAVGATRPPVDEGWAREGQMVGQSGKTIRPILYIGIGISGAMHHVVGMDQSKHIININSNPDADIFETSDIIVTEDFMKILPPLIEELKTRIKEK
ncbi:MAG: electron transfer flavoprotein subunit alpha/FixB family protein [Thermodesulfobacteriota bacterium]|nr:electron transfer flavoprotein subunit alpha/FixB family protein [Thermodesulfobacteriota bacterium]